jgi:predicted transcriptional regulator
MSGTTSIKLKPGLKERIERLAAAEDRSAHWMMNRAIEDFVERREKQRQFDEETIEALQHYRETGLHLTNEEVLEWMEKVIAGENPPMPKPHT